MTNYPPKVENLISGHGNAVANQFEIRTAEGVWLQSYETIIAFRDRATGKVTLDNDWNYSRTTTKYLSQFLNGTNTAEIRTKIESGFFVVADLNNRRNRR
jgi:hypothetical protein